VVGFGLWLIPTHTASDTIQRIINELAASEEGSPTFAPHITLYHPIPLTVPLDDIVTSIREIVRSLKLDPERLDLSVGPAQKGSKYHQSVLAPISPNAALTELRQAVEEKYGLAVDETGESKVYFPHLSLQYGDTSPSRRDELVEVVNSRSGGDRLPDKVVVESIAIVRLQGTTEEWIEEARVSLREQPSSG
jgi:2'-5' RNA ligase